MNMIMLMGFVWMVVAIADGGWMGLSTSMMLQGQPTLRSDEAVPVVFRCRKQPPKDRIAGDAVDYLLGLTICTRSSKFYTLLPTKHQTDPSKPSKSPRYPSNPPS